MDLLANYPAGYNVLPGYIFKTSILPMFFLQN
jgi:hypothetical protein